MAGRDKKRKNTDVDKFEYTICDNVDMGLLVKVVNWLMRKRISKSKGRERVVVCVSVEDVDVFQGRKE